MSSSYSESIRKRFVFGSVQQEAWDSDARYLELEGAYRSTKTTTGLLKLGQSCWDHPGIQWLLARWTEEATFAQLKAAFVELWSDRIAEWLSDEGAFLIHSKDPKRHSKVYVRGLKSSESTQPFAKVHGLLIGSALIDQAEEVPAAYFAHLQTRLSQPGVPQQLILCANPPPKDHWLAKEFPEDGSRRADGFHYIKFRMRDNVAGLGLEFIERVERDLKNKPAEYRRAILGERGLPMSGDPVYAGAFNPDRHVTADVAYNPALPLIESIDFGFRHPAIVWVQFPPGRLHILGGVMGNDVYLDKFLGYAKDIRHEWFGRVEPAMMAWTCDPAGTATNPHGSKSALDILNDHGIYPRAQPDANSPPRRDAAIQITANYFDHAWPDGRPVAAVHPRFLVVDANGKRTEDPVLLDGLHVGYVYDEDRTYSGNTAYPNLRPVKKDGRFEHPMNALEYAILQFAPPDATWQIGLIRSAELERRARRLLPGSTEAIEAGQVVAGLERKEEAALARLEWKRVRLAQRDPDPHDDRMRQPSLNRGAYTGMARHRIGR